MKLWCARIMQSTEWNFVLDFALNHFKFFLTNFLKANHFCFTFLVRSGCMRDFHKYNRLKVWLHIQYAEILSNHCAIIFEKTDCMRYYFFTNPISEICEFLTLWSDFKLIFRVIVVDDNKEVSSNGCAISIFAIYRHWSNVNRCF